MVKMHFFKHVFNVFQKIKFYQQYLISLYIDDFHTFFYASVGILFCAILCIHFSIRLFFFYFFFVNSISISFLLSSLILSTTFILIPTSQTTCITPLQYGAFVELFLKQTKKRQRKVLNRPYYFLLMDRIFYTLLSVKTYINLCWR